MVTFTQLVLIGIPVNTCFPVLANVSQATGKIKWYQIGASVVFLMIPISTYMLYKLGFSVEWAFIMTFVWDIIGLVVRLLMLKKDMQFPVMIYIRKVIYPVILVVVLTIGILVYPLSLISYMGLMYLLLSTILYISSLIAFIWFFGLESYEKSLVNSYIRKTIRK